MPGILIQITWFISSGFFIKSTSMIFFGIRSSRLRKVKDAAYNCLNCFSQDSVHIFYYIKYFHIFRIPVFPLSKYSLSTCGHCKQVLNYYQMSSPLKKSADTDVPGTPVGYFTGLIFFAILFVTFGVLSSLRQ